MSGFCDECDVSLDLHDGPDSCEDAIEKANRAEQMTRMMFGGFLR